MRRIGGAGTLAWGVLALGFVGAALLVVAELSNISSIHIGAAECVDRARGTDRDICETTGGERHAYAFVLLAAFSLVMAWGATAGRSRPAAWALIAVGVVVLGIALISDLPSANDTRGLDVRYTQVSAKAERGLTLEIAGGVLVAAAGALALVALGRLEREEELAGLPPPTGAPR